jgi:nucleotide-binding universal stress UspA family protein
MTMKILLAVDGSKTSMDAVKFVIKHAHWFSERPRLEVVSAHAQISVPRFPGMGGIGKAQMQQYYEEEGGKRLADAKKILDQAGIRYEARVLVGNLAEVIVNHAKKTGCDLIVVGAPQAVIGSVSSKVMHLSEVPVLMVK